VTVPGAPARRDLDAAVRRYARVLARLERLADARLRARRHESAVAWVRVAAGFASCCPAGVLRSPRLEAVLDEVSRAELGAGPGRGPSPAGPSPAGPSTPGARRRVLHVLSCAPSIGGHVNLALRWRDEDRGSDARFVVTRNDVVPEFLRAAASPTNPPVVLTGTSLVEHARELRGLAAHVDVVVCHTHANDPVPGVAFGGDYDGPPVVLVNQADHVFFLGAGNLSVLANLRPTLAEVVSTDARGFAAGHGSFLPVPVPDRRGERREDAKRALGIDPATTVVLTLARDTKYRPSPLHPSFVELVEPVLAEREKCVLLAVGPSSTEAQWASAAKRLDGRIRACGPQPSPGRYLDAADVYVDSFPFSSTTSMLEAAVRDVPVVKFCPYTGLGRLLGGGDVLDDVAITAATPDEHRSRLGALLDEPVTRDELGRRTGDVARALHGPEHWSEALEALYARAGSVAPLTARSEPTACRAAELVDYAAELLGAQPAIPLVWQLAGAVPSLDWGDWLRTGPAVFGVRFVNRVSPRAGAALSGADRFMLPGS
jgi:hypothetical protein